MMWGSAVGGFVGGLAHLIQAQGGPSNINQIDLQLILVTLLGPVAVVFLARRSGAPSMVTVEDFWGGFVVGFMIGYSGAEAFKQFQQK
jgi:hypothetical protein